MGVWDYLVYGTAMVIGYAATRALVGNEVETLISKKA